MKKNFQLFIFFLFTLLAAFLVYMGNDIIIRFNELDEKVTQFEKDVEAMRGALNVVKNFEGVIDKDGKGIVVDESGKAQKPDDIKPAEGFYCNDDTTESLIVELTKDYKINAWNIETEGLKGFSRASKKEATGSYFIRGSNIYVSVNINGQQQNRRIQILKVDKRGFATALELAGKYLSYGACPQEVQLAY